MADIIYEDGEIRVVNPDKRITKEQLRDKIQNLKKHRGQVKKQRDKLTTRMQEIQTKIDAYQDVLAQAGGI